MRHRGITLTEIMVVTLILAIVVLGLMSVLGSGSETYSSVSRVSSSAADLTIIAEEISRELREAKLDTVVVSSPPNSLSNAVTFQKLENVTGGIPVFSTPIIYTFEPETGELINGMDDNGNGSVDEGRIVRLQDGVKRTMIGYVTPDGFKATLNGDVITLQFKVERKDDKNRTIPSNLQTTVKIRN